MERGKLNKLNNAAKDLKKMLKKGFTDNFDINKKKVKNELITDKNRHKILNPANKPKPISKTTIIDESLFPTQVIVKLVSMQGDELCADMTVPISTTTLDLNVMMNKIKKEEELQSYIFLIDNFEVKSNILETLKRSKEFQSEKIVKIVYRPESLFNVKPLTRASATLEGHTDSILACQFSPDGKHLASGGGDFVVRFWDTETETPLFTENSLDEGEKNSQNNLNNKKSDEEEYNSQVAHDSWVLSVSFSPCSSKLASGSIDGKFIIWDPLTGKALTRAIKAHSKWITALVWKPLHLDEDCKLILTASKDGMFKIWNTQTQLCHLSIGAHDDSITKAIWSGENFIYTCSQDTTIKVFDENGVLYKVLKGHAHWINTMTINNEFILRTGCYDMENKVSVDYSDRKSLHSIAKKRYDKFKEKINSSEKIVSGSDDFTLILWDPLNSDKPVNRMTGHQGLVNYVQFSPDTFYLASASFDKSIKIWNGHSGEFLFNFRGHVGPVYQIAWSPDSRLLLTGSKDSTLKCWNVKVKRLMYELPGHADEVYCVDWSPDGEKAVSGSKDRRLRIWKN